MMKAAAKDDIYLRIMREYLGNRKAENVAEEIRTIMQSESKHIHDGETFYVHKDKNGTLVLTMKSVIKNKIEDVLYQSLEKGEVDECLKQIMSENILNEEEKTVEPGNVNCRDSASNSYKSSNSYRCRMCRCILDEGEYNRYDSMCWECYAKFK